LDEFSDEIRLEGTGGAAFAYIHERRLASLLPASWNQITDWLRRVENLKQAA
jgi:hypothetical protein